MKDTDITGENEVDIFSYESIVEDLPIGTLVFSITDGKINIITVNEKLRQFANLIHRYVDSGTEAGWSKEKLQEAFSKNLYAFSVDEDVPIVKSLVEEAAEKGYSKKVFRLRGTSGENTKWIKSMCSSKKINENTRIYYTLFLDHTSQVLYEREILDKQRELEHISRFDTLTNVGNRYSYNQFLDYTKGRIMRNTGVISADVNGLKSANDEFGHLFGDSMLIGFADNLLQFFDRENIFRISGDEFVIIEENVSVIEFENKVNELLKEIGPHNVAAVGYKWETSVIDLKQTIYQAEQLMMIQKQRFYIDNSSKQSKHRPKILEQLLTDFENDRFVVYLQPKAIIGSKRVIGAEALIRKKGEDGSIIPPFEFVPVLERELLISKVDFFVLEEVCKLLKKWKDEGRRLIKISVNMSRVSIAETNFLEHVIEICKVYQTEYKYIELEITETTETKDDRKLLEVISNLHELGFGVALDDMGSDYSSVKMLTIKGVDMVKIDRSLVLQIHDNEGAALIRYIIALCHEIGKQCIAEGVEDEEQAEILSEMGCDFYQGYLLDKPIPIADFEAYLKE